MSTKTGQEIAGEDAIHVVLTCGSNDLEQWAAFGCAKVSSFNTGGAR